MGSSGLGLSTQMWFEDGESTELPPPCEEPAPAGTVDGRSAGSDAELSSGPPAREGFRGILKPPR